MPKILKSEITGSGNISLSGRIKIREYDNHAGAYPSVHRLGDRDRSGIQSLKPFDDQSTLIFGRKIFDDFENSGVDNDTLIDVNKWSHSPGLKIRNEVLRQKNGQINLGKSLVFEGTDTTRFLQTKEKIRNPTMLFSLQQGPYNINKKGLNLGKAVSTDVLKVQISPDASSWTTITTYTPTENLISFYGEENIKQNIFRKNIKLSMQDFPDPGEAYYLRIIQDSISSGKLAVWSIADIEIVYSLENNITFGIQNNLLDEAGKRVYQSYVSTPHTASELTGLGFIRKSVSDRMLTIFENEESITPFNEKIQSLDLTKEFFKTGTDPDIYPGFEISSKNKTIINVDLSCNQETTFGNTGSWDGSTALGSTNNLEIKLMVYYNHQEKKWEKIGDTGLFLGHGNSSSEEDNLQSLMQSSSNAPIGFSPMPVSHMTASEKSTTTSLAGMPTNGGYIDANFYPEDYYASTCLPMDSFGFPFCDQYHATSSQTIKASDIGITKPFVLEKCALDFESKFEFLEAAGNTSSPFSVITTCTLSNSNLIAMQGGYESLLLIPTFFILRQSQQKINKTFTRSYETTRFAAGPVNNQLSGSTIVRQITSGSRELITFGQITIATSGSNSNDYDSRPQFTGINIVDIPQKLLDLGLGRDEVVLHTETASGLPESITGSFSINFPCRTTPKYDDCNPFGIQLTDWKGTDTIKLGDTTFGRGNDLESINRALVNGTGPKQLGTPIRLPQASANTLNGDVVKGTPPQRKTLDLISPYVIFPEDELIFGWQYPLGGNMCQVGATTTSKNRRDHMTLFGNSNLKLIGSLVADKKEYHETINQNLSSNAIYENILGNEKIIDQWQIEVPSEYSGSYLDTFIENIANQTVSNTRENRIGQQVKSIVSGSAGSLGAFGRYVKASDQERIFLDSTKNKGLFFNNSFYGTMNAQGYNVNGAVSNSGIKIAPKYYYNSTHFGYASDLFRQSIDGKYKQIQKTLSKDEIISTLSAINIKFVQGEVLDTPEIKAYKEKDIEELLELTEFQSSNISIFSTSSIPFIDDNTPKNRNYVSASYIAV